MFDEPPTGDHALRPDVLESLLRDPGPVFADVFGRLTHLRDMVDHPIDVKFPVALDVSPTNQRAAAVTQRVGTFRRRYRIDLNGGLFCLINDVAELVTSASPVVSRDGEVITPGSLNASQICEILHEAVKEYVLGENRWAPAERLVTSHEERRLLELRLSAAHRRDFLHMGRCIAMAAFVLGHELGHVVAGHCDPPRFFSRPNLPANQELEADRLGAQFLLDYVMVPPEWWTNQPVNSGNPTHDFLMTGLRANAQQKRHYANSVPGQDHTSPFDVHLRLALSSVGALFIVYELTEKAATQLGVGYGSSYPPAASRYHAFRQTLIERCGIAESVFRDFGGLQTAPDQLYKNFRETVEPISWR